MYKVVLEILNILRGRCNCNWTLSEGSAEIFLLFNHGYYNLIK